MRLHSPMGVLMLRCVRWLVATVLLMGLHTGFDAGCLPAGEPLPSWNDGPRRSAIIDVVETVTAENGPNFVPESERIAVFDNDGTLWCEQPMYVQFAFAIDRVKALAPQRPEWKNKQPFLSILAGDLETALKDGEEAVARLVAATHAGMATDEFHEVVADWLKTARHPKYDRPYTELVYQPMLELLAYLRENGFKTYIVSGGGVDFMRVFSEQVYGIPPEQVIGSRGKLKLEEVDGAPVLFKLPEIDLVDDGPGKPVGIEQLIGRRPVMAFGNSNGDLQMLEWTTAGAGPRFALIVHHTDAQREYAYDRESRIGKLDKALDEATRLGWAIVDIKTDWKFIFPSASRNAE